MSSDTISTSLVTSQAESAACARLLRRLRRLLTDLRLAIDDGDLADAATHWRAAFDLARDDSHTHILAKAAFAASVRCNDTRDYNEAITWMRRAIIVALELKDLGVNQGPNVNNLAIGLARLYILVKDWAKAEDCVVIVREANDVCLRDVWMVRLICAVKRSLSPERIAIICKHVIALPNLSEEFMEKVLSLVGPVCPSLENRCLEMAVCANNYPIVEHILSQCVITHLRRNEKELALEKLSEYTNCFKRRIQPDHLREAGEKPIIAGRAASHYESLVLACDFIVRQLIQEEDYESARRFCALLLDLSRMAGDSCSRDHFEALLLDAVVRSDLGGEAEELVERLGLESKPLCMALVLSIRLEEAVLHRAYSLVSSILKVKDVTPSTKKEVLLILFSWALSEAGSDNIHDVCSLLEELIFDEESFGWLLSDQLTAMTVQLAVRLRLQLWVKANEDHDQGSLHEHVNGICDLIKRLPASPSLNPESQSWLASVCWNLALNTASAVERCRLLSASAGLDRDPLQRANCNLLLMASAAHAMREAQVPPPHLDQLVDIALEQCEDGSSCDQNTKVFVAVFKAQLAVIRNIRLGESLMKIIETDESNFNILLTLSALFKLELNRGNFDISRSSVLKDALMITLRKAADLALAREAHRQHVVVHTLYLMVAEAVDQKNLSLVAKGARDLLAFLRSISSPSELTSGLKDVLANTLRRAYAATLLAAGDDHVRTSLVDICKQLTEFTHCHWDDLENKAISNLDAFLCYDLVGSDHQTPSCLDIIPRWPLKSTLVEETL